jgi:hypothetical protein
VFSCRRAGKDMPPFFEDYLRSIPLKTSIRVSQFKRTGSVEEKFCAEWTSSSLPRDELPLEEATNK